MKISFWPKSLFGKWSVGLAVTFFVFFGVLVWLISLGETGGETFFSNPKLAILGILAGITVMTGFLTGIVSIFRKERSILVFLATIVGLLVSVFILGEILVPH